MREANGQRLLDFGEENDSVYYGLGKDGLYEALSLDNEFIISEMETLLKFMEMSDNDKMNSNETEIIKINKLKEKYFVRQKKIFLDYMSKNNFNGALIDYLRKNLNSQDLFTFSSNEEAVKDLDMEIGSKLNLQDNIHFITDNILGMIFELNKDLLKTTLKDSIEQYIKIYINENPDFNSMKSILLDEFIHEEKFQKAVNEVNNKLDLDVVEKIGNTYYADFFGRNIDNIDEIEQPKDNLFCHFFSFVIKNILKEMAEYELLYKDQLTIEKTEESLEIMKESFACRKELLSSEKKD